jgi:hypothetical protein
MLTAAEIVAINAARNANARRMEEEEERAGAAIRRQHVVLGGVGKYPQRRRMATSNCGPQRRNEHRKMVAVPS